MKKYLFLGVALTSGLMSFGQCIESLPYMEDFEGSSWTVPATSPNAGTVDPCWSRSNSTTYYWRPNTGSTSLTNTGPSADHTTGSGKYLHAEINGSSTSLTTSIATPWCDLVGTTSPKLRFFHHLFGFNITGLTAQVQVFGSSSWTNLSTQGVSQTASTDPWNSTTEDLSTYVGDTVRFRFISTRSNAFGQFIHIGIDDIMVWDATCTTPNSLNVQSKTQTSVTLAWSSTTSGAVVRYVEAGQPLSAATVVNVGTNNPATITGLLPSTTYSFWVQDSCGVGNFGPWVGPITTTTNCGTINAPWFEDFEDLSFVSPANFNSPGSVNPCWVRSPNNAGYMWITGPPAFAPFNTGPASGHNNSSKWAQASRVGFSTNTSGYIRTPRINLSNLTNPELSFWYHAYGASIDRLEVDVATPGNGWQNVLVISGQSQSSQTDPWIEEVISLSAYANQDVFIRFQAFNSGNVLQASVAIDDIGIQEAPPCPRPNPFNVNAVTDVDATFSWTSGGTAPWQIEYGPSGFAPGSGTRVNVTTNPYTLTGLTPNTVYDVYIRDTCGALGVSTWTGPVEINTQCSPVSAPFVENFDGSAFVQGTFNTQGTFDPCWFENPSEQELFWTPSPPPFINAQTGPVSDHTSGTGDYIYVDGLFSSTVNDSAVLLSPLVDLSTLTIPELTFWYHMFGANIQSMAVDINDGTSWSRVWTLSGQQQTSGTASWQEAIVDLSSYSNTIVQVRFVGKRTAAFGNRYRMAIDDFDIHEQPACPQPTNVISSAQTTTSIDLSWNGGIQTSWIVEYGPEGFPIGTGTQVTVSTTPSTTIGSLFPSTSYDFYVTTDCGSSTLSDTIGPRTFSTLCGPIAAPYVEDFEGSDWVVPQGFPATGDIPNCWARSDTFGYFWVPANQETFPLTSGPSGDNTTGSGKYIYTDRFGLTNDETSITTPSIDLTPLDTPQISFFYFAYGSDIQFLKLEIKGSSGTWTNLWTQNGQFQTSNTEPWKEEIVDLTAYQNQTVEFRWVGKRTTGFLNNEIALDDIRVDEKPQCPAPTDISATPVGQDAIQVQWTTGGATTWQIEYGPQGFIPGTGTFITTVSNPVVINGLNSNTPYEFYVRDSCSSGSFSWSVGPAVATTYPCANACLYELTLTDQFSNGWTAGGVGLLHYLDVKVAGTTTSYTLATGGSITYDIAVCDGQAVELFFRNNGFFSGQCGVVFKDPSGTTLFTKSFSGIEWPTGSKYLDTGACTPVCQDPVGLAVVNITPNSADFVWSSISGYSNVAFGPAGFNPTVPNQWGNTSGTYNLSALTQNTTYDVYVQDSCSNGLLSSWVGPISFTTLSCGPVTSSFVTVTNGFQGSFDGTGSSSNVAVYDWDFGDGTSGSGANTGHTYASSGLYNVMLVVSNACGDSDTSMSTIVVCGVPVASFGVNTLGLDVTVDGTTSTGIGFSYDWDFGDGNTGIGPNPTHTYAAPGTYDITLIATDTCGASDTTIQSVTVCAAPIPAFSFTVSGFDVTFDGSATQFATSYLWTFGDGNSATGVNPTHTYGSNQNFTVTLTAINACGDSISFSQIVALCSVPDASWTYNIISSGGSGMLVQFDATASVGTTFEWDFGDGQTASGTNFPTHTYVTPGLFYRVTLIVGNACNETDTLSYRLNQIGLDEESELDITVYPNPSDGVLFIDGENLQLTGYSLMNLQGQVLLQGEMTGDEVHQIELPVHWSNGVYLLELKSNEATSVQRIILRR